ncbi:MAG TPA: FtsX-like permease family protein [Candidatus Binatia bacterium]
MKTIVMLRLLRQISVPYLRASWGRTVLIAGGITTGVALIVAITVINASVLANFRRTVELMAGPAALEVTLGVGELGFAESTIETVRADPDVAAAMPLVRGTVALADDPSETLQLFGVDLIGEDALARYQISTATARSDIVRSLEDPRSILLTTTFAHRHQVGVRVPLRLTTVAGVDDFTVQGLLEVQGLAAAFGGQIAIMDLSAAQRVLGKADRVDQIDVVLRHDANAETVRARLERALPAVLTVARPEQRAAQYDRILESFQAMLTGLSLLCLVAGVFVIYNTTSTGAVHRARTMAMLRLIGAESTQLWRLLMVEALALGVLGAALGIVVGIVLASLLVGMVTDSMGVIFELHFVVDRLTIDPERQLVVGVSGVAVALLASLFAARRVAALSPLEAIQPSGQRITDRSSDRLFWWWIVLVGASVMALVAEVRLKSIAWGNLGSTLWFASTIVIAIPLVRRLTTRLSVSLPRAFGGEGRIAAESLFGASTRTGLTVGGIALVLSIGITVASVALSFRRSVDSYFRTGPYRGDLVVSAVATEGGWLEVPIPEAVGDEIRPIPGIARVELFRGLFGQMFRGARIGVFGVPNGVGSRYPAEWYREGNPSGAAHALDSGQGVLVTINLADRFDLHVGQMLDLDTPSGVLSLPIVGVIQDFSSDRGAIALNRRVFAERWQDSRVTRIFAFLDGTTPLETVRARITERLGERYRLKMLSMQEVLTFQEGMIDRAFAFTDALHLLVAIVAVAGIFDLLLSSILERRRDLAIWRLIGADEQRVRRSVVLESATIGTLGTILGIPVGVVTAGIWVGVNFRYLLGYYLNLHFAFGTAAAYVALVMTMTVIAGYAAAYQATGQSILGGIRND